MRVSLKSILALITVAAVGCVALRFAGPLAISIALGAAMLALMATAVVAAVGRDAGRVMAIGALVCAAIYGAALWRLAPTEFGPRTGLLPTSQLLASAYGAIVRSEPATIKPMNVPYYYATPTYNPSATPTPMPSRPRPPEGAARSAPTTPGVGLSIAVPAMQPVAMVDTPPGDAFMLVGHTLWAALLAWLGGLFAVWVHRARDGNAPAAA